MVRSASSLTVESRVNTALAWLVVTGLIVVEAMSVMHGEIVWAVFTAAVLVVALLPNAIRRTPHFLLPWELLFLVALPLIAGAMEWSLFTDRVSAVVGVAGFALIITVELELLTETRMPSWFAVVFTVVTALAAAGAWAIILWLSDVYRGTVFIPSNDVLMQGLIAAALTGTVAGVVFDQYFRRHHELRQWLQRWFP